MEIKERENLSQFLRISPFFNQSLDVIELTEYTHAIRLKAGDGRRACAH